LAPLFDAAVAERGPSDAAVASSMTHVAALAGLCRRSLGDARIAMFMHENQLTFPLSSHDRLDLSYAMVNWTSMIAADLVVFNSRYHRDEWNDALPDFLSRLPDQRHNHLVAGTRDRSVVLPVGIDLRSLDAVPRFRGDRALVLWNHRREYDKGPDELADALSALLGSDVEFEVALAGERFADEPPAFARLRSELGERLVHDGHAAPDTYRALLRRADVVVSTARHEFFGVAVAEAIHAGAFPVVPNRLVYPERIPTEHHDACLYDTWDGLVERLRWAVTNRDRAAEIAARLRPAVADFDWSLVAPIYDEVFTGGRGAS